MTTTTEYETFALDAVCEMTGAPSVDWLSRRITSGETPAVLAGQHWRMTRADMAVLVEQMREAGQRKLADLAARRPAAASSARTETTPADAGLSPRAAARMKRRKKDAA
ncbi:hypothetical protein [Nocardia arizonensis]|uniref:hypothetical protein n=1 Tax=Nocardia arizonensis TaxID=1141647 RepID=UPI0006D2A3B7|nr:hypothetical protein [Nocardia arizonensis]